MIINHNLGAMNANRNMGINASNASKSMEKLSSGLRINKAGDDAAGLAISEKMRGQIRGLDQASSNAQAGISLIQTAEGALNETTSILQRMRELSVQSSSDTATNDDRKAMQTEVSQLNSEINRIATTTQFNTKTLLNGDLSTGTVAQGTKLASVNTTIGATAIGVAPVNNDSYSFSSDMTLAIKVGDGTSANAKNITIAKGNYTETTLAAAITTAAQTAGANSTATVTFSAGKLTVTDTAAPTGATAATAGVLTVSSSTSTVAPIVTDTNLNDYVNNSISATAADVSGLVSAGVAVNVDAGKNALEVKAGAGKNTLSVSTGNVAAQTVTVATGVYSGTQLAQAINTGISNNAQLKGNAAATFNAVTNKLTMASTDNSAITVAGSATAGDLTLTTGYTTSATALTASDTTTALLINLKDADKNSLGLASGNVITINGNINGSAVTPKTLTISATSTIADLAQSVASTFNLAASSVSIDTAKGTINVVGQDGTSFALSNLKLTAADASGNALSLFNNKFSSMKENQAAQDTHVDSSLNFQIGANEGQTMKMDINKMNVQGLALASVDISTQQGAETATTVIDNATAAVSSERAKLGAFSNRLEHTINNLGTSSENLTSAESRIRDVDMAKEMSTFSKNNILSQAAQAMLAQANQQPQQVLQLLR